MGDHGSRPNRMARLRIIVCMMLLLSAHINVSNSNKQERRAKRHLEKRNKVSVSHPEIHSKARVSSPEVHGKADVSLPEVQSKARVSSPEVHGKADVSRPEVQSKARVSYLPMHSKTQVSIPKILEKLFRLDRHSKQREQAGNMLNVKGCPSDCYCRLKHTGDQTALLVKDCESDPIDALPKLFDSYGNLTQVHLVNCHLTRLPVEIMKLPLEVVELNMNEFTELPPELLELLPQLHELYMNNNILRCLPADVAKWSTLTMLELGNNMISELPQELGGMRNLLLLDLNHNKLQSLPESIGTLAYLEELNISYNGLQSLPNEITKLKQLKILDLDHNSLQEVPCGFVSWYIIAISVGYNNISTLPKSCKLFTNGQSLGYINFNHNNIDILHFSSLCPVDSSQQLRYVGFGHNRISTIDTSDSKLDQCFDREAYINLEFNLLSALDSWPMLLSQDKKIRLNVGNNNLSQFTSSSGSFLYASQYGSVFRMHRNQVRHFMDIFNGWKVIVNTTERLNFLLVNAYFDLSYNPLVCDCVDYEVYRHIQILRPEQYNDLMCNEPLSLRGQNPKHIALGHFACDIDVNCPDGCACSKVPDSQTINVTCLSYNRTDIPEIVPDLPKQNYGYRLEICNQDLNEIKPWPYLQKATEIILSNNSNTSIKIKYCFAFQRVKILHLDNNNLQKLPGSVAELSNETAVDIRLGGNPWVCDCAALAMKNWIMLNLEIVKDHDMIVCHSPTSMVGVKVKAIERSIVCPNEPETAVYFVASISTVVLIFIVYLATAERIKYAYWRFIGRDECVGECKEFDIFMCACSAEKDAEYVENYLIPELEKRDFRVLYHREHFHPGKPIHVNMSEAIEKSKRTLVFFSNNFNVSRHSMFEFHSAHYLDIENHTRQLITIKDTDLDMSQLDVYEVLYFQTHTYVDRGDVNFWQLLENALPRKRLGAQIRPEGT